MEDDFATRMARQSLEAAITGDATPEVLEAQQRALRALDGDEEAIQCFVDEWRNELDWLADH